MQSLACETQKSKLHSQGILTNLVTIMREEGRFRPVQVYILQLYDSQYHNIIYIELYRVSRPWHLVLVQLMQCTSHATRS